MDWLRSLWEMFWQPKPTVFGAIIGVMVTHLWQKFRNRMAVLGWSVQYQHLAMAIDDVGYGKVEILYNGTPVSNLKMCYLQIENESSSDLTDIEVCFSFQDGTNFLTGSGFVEGGTHPFPFSDRFAESIKRVLDVQKEKLETDRNLSYILSHREFHIPVLNRYTKAIFMLLITGTTPGDPSLQVSCVHKALRLRPRPAPRWVPGVIFGVPMSRAAGIGFLLGLLGTVVVTNTISSIWAIGSVAFILGAAVTLIGVASIRVGRYVLRLFG